MTRLSRKNANQLSLFTGERDAVLEEIRGIDPVNLTPLDALQRLSGWKQRLE